MKVGWAIIGFLVALITTAVSNLVTEELRSRLDLMPYAVLRLAIRRLPAELRKNVGDEWLAELHHILHRTESLPLTRVVSAVLYTLGLLHTARRIGRGLRGIRTSAVTIPRKPVSDLVARVRVTPVRAVSVPAAISTQRRKWWLITACVVAALALIGGSAVGATKYLSSRYPTVAEQALLAEVPLVLTIKNSCARNIEAEQDTANVQASVICISDADANRVVFTKFTSLAQATRVDTDYVKLRDWWAGVVGLPV